MSSLEHKSNMCITSFQHVNDVSCPEHNAMYDTLQQVLLQQVPFTTICVVKAVSDCMGLFDERAAVVALHRAEQSIVYNVTCGNDIYRVGSACRQAVHNRHLEAEHAYAVLATSHQPAFLMWAELDCLDVVV